MVARRSELVARHRGRVRASDEWCVDDEPKTATARIERDEREKAEGER
jgi:hypothetical protein